MQTQESMCARAQTCLAVVTYLFLLIGVAGVMATIFGRVDGLIAVHGEIIGLLIFAGLRYYSWHARTLALLTLLVWLLLLPLVAYNRALHLDPGDIKITMGGETEAKHLPIRLQPLGVRFPTPRWMDARVTAILYGCLFSGMFVVLLRKDVRSLFLYPPGRPIAASRNPKNAIKPGTS